MEELHFTREWLPLPEGAGLNRRYAVREVLEADAYGIAYACFDYKAGQTVTVLEYFPREYAVRAEGSTAVSPRNKGCGPLFFQGSDGFLTQYQALMQAIGNPNIVSVFDTFFENGTSYAVTEPLDGITLGEYPEMKGAPVSEGELLHIGLAMSDALLVVHSLGILHGGITGDSVLLCTDGTVKLTSFGAARRILQQKQPLSYEEPWTDIRGLGAALYQSYTLEQPPGNPETLYREMPQALAGMFEGMLSPNPAIRFESVFDFRHAVAALEYQPERPQVTILRLDEYRADRMARLREQMRRESARLERQRESDGQEQRRQGPEAVSSPGTQAPERPEESPEGRRKVRMVLLCAAVSVLLLLVAVLARFLWKQ